MDQGQPSINVLEYANSHDGLHRNSAEEAIVTPVSLIEPLALFFELSADIYHYAGDCRIHSNSLLRNELNIYVKGVYIKRDISAKALAQFKPVEKIKLGDGSIIDLDYRGLWSVDASALRSFTGRFDRIPFENNATTAFITVSGSDGNYSKYECALVEENF